MQDLEQMAEASDFISHGDLMNIQIRTQQNWSLLPNFGILSSVAPCCLVAGKTFYPGFPQWLGKNSSSRKAKRLLRELKQRMSGSVSADQYSIQNEMVPFLLETILKMLKKGQIEEVLDFMDDLKITNEMVKEHLMGLCLNKKTTELFDKIESRNKSAFTREYNK